MDYNVEMLHLYFKEMGYTPDEINDLLESNPFGYNFIRWERSKYYDNKVFSSTIKKYKLVHNNDRLYEICVSRDSTVSGSFINDKVYRQVGANESLGGYMPYNYKVIMNGLYINADFFIKKLKYKDIDFIVGVSTSNLDYYNKARKFYEELYYELGCKKIEEYNGVHKTCILCSK